MCICDDGYLPDPIKEECVEGPAGCVQIPHSHFEPPNWCFCDAGYFLISTYDVGVPDGKKSCAQCSTIPNAGPADDGIGCVCADGFDWKDRSCTLGVDCECEDSVAHLLEEEELGLVSMCLFE